MSCGHRLRLGEAAEPAEHVGPKGLESRRRVAPLLERPRPRLLDHGQGLRQLGPRHVDLCQEQGALGLGRGISHRETRLGLRRREVAPSQGHPRQELVRAAGVAGSAALARDSASASWPISAPPGRAAARRSPRAGERPAWPPCRRPRPPGIGPRVPASPPGPAAPRRRRGPPRSGSAARRAPRRSCPRPRAGSPCFSFSCTWTRSRGFSSPSSSRVGTDSET